MSTEGHPTKASLRELEPLFAEAAGRDGAARRHSTLRLQPTVLPPPPEDSAAPPVLGASHEDDLDLALEADDYARRRQWLLAAAGVAIAIAGAVGYLAFGPVQGPPPEAVVRPPAVVVAPPADPAPAAPVVAAPAAPPAAPRSRHRWSSLRSSSPRLHHRPRPSPPPRRTRPWARCRTS